MEELNADGFERFISIFTALMFACESAEVVQKMCSIMSLMPFQQKSLYLRKQILMGLFVALYICKHLSISAEFIVQKIVELFDKLVLTMKQTRNDKESNQQTWELVYLFMDYVSCCFEHPVPGAENLICSSYGKLLKITTENQQRIIYSYVGIILSSILQLHTVPTTLASLLWRHIYPSIENIFSVHGSGDMFIAPVLARFTLISLERYDIKYLE